MICKLTATPTPITSLRAEPLLVDRSSMIQDDMPVDEELRLEYDERIDEFDAGGTYPD
jgi:hypothetical protein